MAGLSLVTELDGGVDSTLGEHIGPSEPIARSVGVCAAGTCTKARERYASLKDLYIRTGCG